MKALRIGATEVRRIVRDRVNLFFLFVFPIILILLLGATFGGSSKPKVGLLVEDDGALAVELAESVEDDRSVVVERRADREEMLADVERGALGAAVIVPRDYSSTLASGGDSSVTFVAKPGAFGEAVRAAVDGAVGEQAARVRAARVAAAEAGSMFGTTYEIAGRVASFARLEVDFVLAGDRADAPLGSFDTGASTQLILFTFVNSLAGSVALVQTRTYGVLRRMLAAPVSTATILLGQTAGRFLVALLQSVFIVFAAALLFGVNWGDPLGAAAVVALFSLVSTGAAMLAGAAMKNEQQAGALVPFALALAALGGSMVPLEVFPPTMRTISRITPHAWANEAFGELIANGSGVADIVPQLLALAGFAVVLLAAGTLLLRRSLTS